MKYVFWNKELQSHDDLFIYYDNLAIIVKEDVSFFSVSSPHLLEMYSRFQANNMNAEMPKKSPLRKLHLLAQHYVQLLPICSGLF